MHAVCGMYEMDDQIQPPLSQVLDIKSQFELGRFLTQLSFTTIMPLVHLSPYCQKSATSSSTTPLMTSYSTPTSSSTMIFPSSTYCNTSIDPNNMITHTTISLRKRRMPCQRRRKTHYCYGCEAKVWVHLHSETLVPICHRCLGAFVVALREGGVKLFPCHTALTCIDCIIVLL